METLTTMQPQMVLKKQSSTYKLIIERNLEDKIRYLCGKFPTVEWSGVLFYDYTGNFKDDSLVIRCKDLFLMDIGNATFTEYLETPEVISYMMENNLLSYYAGNIHSHNQMATFFSGTDQNTLLQEGQNMNNFLSLIVNNAGVYNAAITRRVTVNEKIISNNTFKQFGEDVPIKMNEEISSVHEEIQYNMFDIIKENYDMNVLEKRIADIKESKETKEKELQKSVNTYNEDYSSWYNDFYSNRKRRYDDYGNFKSYALDNNHAEKTKKVNEENLHKNANELFSQLVTGSVLTTDAKNIDIDRWLNNIDTRFAKRFKNMENIEYWASGFVDIVLNTTEFTKEALKEVLVKFAPYRIQSNVVDALMNELENYQ